MFAPFGTELLFANIVPGLKLYRIMRKLVWVLTFFLFSLSVFSQDIELKNIFSPAFVHNESAFAMKILVKNNGSATINELNVDYRVNNGNWLRKHLSGIELKSVETKEFTVSNILILQNEGTVDIEAKISMVNGETEYDPNNNYAELHIPVLNRYTEKLILLEHFTNAGCPNCTSGNQMLFDVIANPKVSDKVCHVAYHVNFPGYDPFYEFNQANQQGNVRVDYYDAYLVPHVYADGNRWIENPINTTAEKLLIFGNQIAPFYLDGFAETDGENIKVGIDLEQLANINNPYLVLFTVLTQSKEYGTAPGSNGETFFPNAMRYILPTEKGLVLGDLTEGENKYFEISHILDNEIDTDSSSVLLFIQDVKTKDIYQAQKITINAAEAIKVRATPEDGAINAETGNALQITFNQTAFKTDGSPYTTFDGLVKLLDNTDTEQEIQVTFLAEQNRISVIPTTDLKPNTTYTLKLETSFQGANGVLADSWQSAFTTRSVGTSALLKKVAVNHMNFASFSPETFVYDVPYSDTTTQVPFLSVATEDVNAHFSVEQATEFPGITTVTIVSEDGLQQKEYRFNFYKASLNNNATLSSITVNSANLETFSPEVFSYDIQLENNTIPQVSVTTSDVNATFEIENALSIPGETIIRVLAENNVGQNIYRLNFLGVSAINENESEALRIYPNPAQDFLMLETVFEDVIREVSLFSIDGTLVKRVNCDYRTEMNIPLNGLNNGIYFISLQFKDKVITKKFIIAR